MKEIRNENIVYFDVDETLITWTGNSEDIEFDYYGQPVYAKQIIENIRFLKAVKQRGAFVIVHTGNGWQWAKHVIERLNLMEYVDLVMTKPSKYVDDKDFDTFATRIHLGNDENRDR